jgi:hypothetical protein
MKEASALEKAEAEVQRLKGSTRRVEKRSRDAFKVRIPAFLKSQVIADTFFRNDGFLSLRDLCRGSVTTNFM